MIGRDAPRLSTSSKNVPPRAPAASPSRDPFGLRGSAKVADALAPARTPAAPSVTRPVSDEGYYAIVPSGPAVDLHEVETEVPAVEVTVSWGERDVLRVAHLAPPRPFVVGESRGDAISPDFELESAFLGLSSWSVVEPRDGSVVIFVPAGASLRVRSDDAILEHEALLANGSLLPSSSLAGGLERRLLAGETASVSYRGFVFAARAVSAGRAIAAPVRADRRLLAITGGVAAIVFGLLGLASSLTPEPSLLTADSLDLQNRYVVAAIQENERVRDVVDGPAAASAQSSDAASGDPGEMGDRSRPTSQGRASRQGDADPSESSFVPTSSIEAQARDNVVVNAVAEIASLFASGSDAPYSADQALGADSLDTLGALIGARIASSGGNGGLGPIGTGLGGGGDGDGTVGPGNGEGSSPTNGDSPYRTHGLDHGGCTDADCGAIGARDPARIRVPVPRPQTSDEGGLTGDQVRRVIQRNIAQVQHCYEQGLQSNPALAGRVTVSFLISPSGAVSSSTAQDGVGSAAVSTCISSAVRRWSFPQTSNGLPVSVRFPFTLQRANP